MMNIGYFIKEGVRGLYQAKVMSAVSIATVATTLFLADILVAGLFTVGGIFERAVDRADVVAYIADRAMGDTVTIGKKIRSFPQVSGTALVTKEAARGRFAAIYDSAMLDAVDENPLPVSIEITLKKEYSSVAAAADLTAGLERIDGVESVRYAKEWMDLVSRVRHYLLIGVLVLGGFLLVILHVTIAHSVRLTIYARRELIRTMHLVGASRFFVAMPFIVEGVLQGIIGGWLAVIGTFILRASIPQSLLDFGQPVYQGLPILAGAFFGWLGSAFATRKFLV
ncbi:MAG: permease-like cell division protein FtsX [Chitinispirillaceae bacterium]|jgi:cell division transport system permease protein|nr:permease-like cell division protein FtsX [Chitinispirillaceae bacterium]